MYIILNFLNTITMYILVKMTLYVFIGFMSGFINSEFYGTLFLLLILSIVRMFLGSRKILQFMMSFYIFILEMFFILECVSYYFTSDTFNQAFMFHMNLDSIHFISAFYFQIFGLIFVISLLVYLEIKINKMQVKNLSFTMTLLTVILILLLIGFIPNSVNRFIKVALFEIETSSFKDSISYLQLNEKKDLMFKKDISMNVSKAKNNLMIIYLESLENEFFNDKKYPGLMPMMSKKREEGIFIENIYQKPGTSFSIGGIFASQCGWPVGILGKSKAYNSILRSNTSKDFICLGDILKGSGYYLSLLLGSSADFAGMRRFFLDHEFDEINDINTLDFKDRDKSIFGLNDTFIFKSALQKIVYLKNKSNPYAIVTSTTDTHFPGFVDDRCPSYDIIQAKVKMGSSVYKDERLFRAAHCLDLKLYNFINAALNADPSLIIFIMPDHLYPKKREWKDRKLYFFAVGKEVTKKSIKHTGTHFDIAPTVLDILGIKHNVKFGLGVNLLKYNSPYSSIKSDDIIKKTIPVIRDFIKKKQIEKLDLSSGIIFDSKKQEIRIGKRKFSNNVGLTTGKAHKWQGDKYLYIELDFKKNIISSGFYFESDIVAKLMRDKGGILVGNISEISSLCLPKDRALCQISPMGVLIKNIRNPETSYYQPLNVNEDYHITNNICRGIFE